MKFTQSIHPLSSLVLVITLAHSAVSAQEKPASLQALEKRGVNIVGTFPSPGGLTAWAGYMDTQPMVLYQTPDGKHVIAGTMFNANGKDVTEAMLGKAVDKRMSEGVWGKLQDSRWVADGKDTAPRTVYVFTDPNCPYCNKFWADARPWVESGKVQLRHVMVGILRPSSAGKAAALLADKDPVAALAAHSATHVSGNAQAMAAGRPRPLEDKGVKPLASIPPAIQAKLSANAELMASLGLRATPAVAWRDAKGSVQMRTGVPDNTLTDILGPR